MLLINTRFLSVISTYSLFLANYSGLTATNSQTFKKSKNAYKKRKNENFEKQKNAFFSHVSRIIQPKN